MQAQQDQKTLRHLKERGSVRRENKRHDGEQEAHYQEKHGAFDQTSTPSHQMLTLEPEKRS
jgi:hypothetical protein